MPQFPVTEARRKILERIPDYAVEIAPCEGKVTVKAGDMIVAETTGALLVRETRHADVYYLPREDVDLSSLEPTELSTYCPFKGHAAYWSLAAPGLENIVWSYEDPFEQVEPLRGYMSFYTDRVEQIVDQKK